MTNLVAHAWLILVVGSPAMLSCGSKDAAPSADKAAGTAATAAKPAAKPAKLPVGFPEAIDDAMLAKGAEWARKSPEKVPGRKGMHVPGGGQGTFNTGARTIFTQRYDASIDQVLAGLLVLLADDGYMVSNLKRDSDEKLTFDVVPPSGLGALALVSSPAGQKATSAGIAMIFGQPDETAADAPKGSASAEVAAAPKDLVGTRVRAHWEYNGELSGGKISKVYGAYGKVAFNDGDIGWDRLESMQPKQAAAADPTGDTCAFKVGDKVLGRWSRDKMMGTIDKLYFGLAHIKFVGGAPGWDECTALSQPKK